MRRNLGEKQRPREFAKKLMLQKFHPRDENPFQRDEFPLLRDIAIETVAQNFKRYSHLMPYPKKSNVKIPEEEQQIIISKTSTNKDIIPITVSAQSISQESYWKRACEERWGESQKTINLETHGLSWKVAYLERHLQEFLQSEEPPSNEDLVDELKAISYWIHTLNLTNMKSNQEILDIDFIAKNLPILTSLTMTYGMKSEATDDLFSKDKKNEFHRQNLGIKLSEAANLGEAIKSSINLLYLSLPANMIDDDLLRFIIAGINSNQSLIELNLSHNKIGDQGARRLAKFLMRNEILIHLNISNNQISYDGSRYLAQSLKVNKTLTHLNMSLNSLSDKAGAKFFKDLMMNRILIELNISGNQFSYLTAMKLADYLIAPCTLRILMVGNNQFEEKSKEKIKGALNTNYHLQYFDVRGCIFNKEESDLKIQDALLRQYGQTQAERQLSEIVLKNYFNKERLNFVEYEEYENKILKEKMEKKAQKQNDKNQPNQQQQKI